MTSYSKQQKWFYYFVLYFVVLAVFGRKFEWYVLDFTCTDWLMGPTTDNIVDQVLWEYYRYALPGDQWGVFYNYAWPQAIGIGNVSMIPLMAIPFKLLGPILPASFQYFGWFVFTCFLLQTFFADKLLRLLGLPLGVHRLAGSLILTLAPVLLIRDPHISLCAQWLILWGLCLYFDSRVSFSRLLIYAVIMACLAALIHPYLILFPLSWAGVMAWRQVLPFRFKEILRALALLVLPVLAVYACFYFTGMFSLGEGESSSSGFGRYSANMNTFFNSMGNSRWGILDLPNRFYEQYEGFAYLGAGVLLLWLGVLVSARKTLPLLVQALRKHYALILATLALAIYATGFAFCWNEHLVYEKRFSDEHRLMLSIFRSSGRYIWLAHYLCIVLPLVLLYKSGQEWKLSKLFAGFVLIGAAVQLYDIEPLYVKHTFKNNFHPPQAYPYYAEIAQSAQVIYTFPAYERKMEVEDDVQYLLHAAAPFRTKISGGFLPRPSLPSQYPVTDKLREVISEYDWLLGDTAVVMVGKDQGFLFAGLLNKHPNIHIADLGDNYVLYPESNKRMMDLAQHYAWRIPHFDLQEIGEFLDQYPDCYWLMAVKDDAASGITAAMKSYFQDKHSRLADLQYREAYVAVFYQKQVLFEKADYSHAQVDTSISIPSGNLRCYMESVSAWEEKNFAKIMLEGEDLSLNERGINIVILDAQGKVLRRKNFDTFLSSLSTKD